MAVNDEIVQSLKMKFNRREPIIHCERPQHVPKRFIEKANFFQKIFVGKTSQDYRI